MAEGWIKIHRKMLQWQWYTDVVVYKLFTHLLLLANHEKKEWRGNNIARGQLITSVSKLATGAGLTVQQVRTALNKLKSTKEITIESCSLNTRISIVNIDKYNPVNKHSNKPSTNDQQSSNKPSTTTKKYKNDKKEENDKNKRHQMIFEDRGFVERVYMNWRITEAQLWQMLIAFDLSLAAAGKDHSEYVEYRKHFHNWGAKKFTEYQKTGEQKKEMTY